MLRDLVERFTDRSLPHGDLDQVAESRFPFVATTGEKSQPTEQPFSDGQRLMASGHSGIEIAGVAPVWRPTRSMLMIANRGLGQ